MAGLVGKELGPFKITKELGSGAMGTVYRGVYTKPGDPLDGTVMAVKTMAPSLASQTAQKRFKREVEVLKQLNHPNIVRYYGAGKTQGVPFYAMEYVEGESLDKVLARRGRFTWEEVVELGKQLCAALQHAHDQGIVHRDLKPSNLMLLPGGTLKLMDFGIAKDLDVTALTAANCTVGTAAYMSPEQCKGERNLSPKSDLYSMGVLFYELLTGDKPFQAPTPVEMFMAHVNEQAERPSRKVLDLPVWLDTLVMQLLEKKTDHRPFDAATVRESLNRVAEKVAAQQSAGVEMANARAVDRPRGDAALDETDKEAARTLAGRPKRRKRKKAVYERRWFQGAVLGTLLAVIVGVLVWVSLPASADKLYAQAEKLVQSSNPEDHKAALKGPLREYLRRYGNRDDAQAKKVRQWAADLEANEKSELLTGLVKSHKGERAVKIEPETDAERQALDAALTQEGGDLVAAREKWQKLDKLRDDADPDNRGWGVLATRKLQEIDQEYRAAVAKDQELTGWYEQYLRTGQPVRPETDAEQQAFLARRYEEFGDPYQARRRWLEVRKVTKSPVLRPWGVLAVQRLQDKALQPEPLPEPEEIKARQQLLQDKLKVARESKPPVRRWLAQELIALYDKNADLAKEVEEAKKLLQEEKPETKG
jgi:eukaryotic-like serine/threonine-protein kinase